MTKGTGNLMNRVFTSMRAMRAFLMIGLALLMGISSFCLAPAVTAQSPVAQNINFAALPQDDDGDWDDDWDDDYYGFIQSRPSRTAGTWVIGGRSFTASSSTYLDPDDGPLSVGACASVDYEGSRALEIESEPASDCDGNSAPDRSRGFGAGTTLYPPFVIN